MDVSPPSRLDPQAAAAPPRTRSLDEYPELAALAADLLRTPSAMLDLPEADARCIVQYMRLVNLPRGSTLFSEGDRSNSSYMLLVLAGEVSVNMADLSHAEGLPVSVLGPGNLVGELGLLDGGPRSTTCKAVTDVQAAGLSRAGLLRLVEEHPRVAARLLVGVAQRIGDRLRALGEHILLYARLAADQQAEIDRLKLRAR